MLLHICIHLYLCHTTVRGVLSWVFVFWISCFILSSSSPLVSGHLPFILCNRSDVIPNPWLFPPVLPSLMCIKSMSSPVCVASVFHSFCWIHRALFIVLFLFTVVKFCFMFSSEEEWFCVYIFLVSLLFLVSYFDSVCFFLLWSVFFW